MTKEERRQYAKEYRQEGFGALNDRNYYLRHREAICAKERARHHAKRQKLSQDAHTVGI